MGGAGCFGRIGDDHDLMARAGGIGLTGGLRTTAMPDADTCNFHGMARALLLPSRAQGRLRLIGRIAVIFQPDTRNKPIPTIARQGAAIKRENTRNSARGRDQ